MSAGDIKASPAIHQNNESFNRVLSWNFTTGTKSIRSNIMINLAIIFLVIAIIAGILGITGVMSIAMEMAWILFVVGLILAIVFWIIGRRPPPI